MFPAAFYKKNGFVSHAQHITQQLMLAKYICVDSHNSPTWAALLSQQTKLSTLTWQKSWTKWTVLQRKVYTHTNEVQRDTNYFSWFHWICNMLLRSKICQNDGNQKPIQAVVNMYRTSLSSPNLNQWRQSMVSVFHCTIIIIHWISHINTPEKIIYQTLSRIKASFSSFHPR